MTKVSIAIIISISIIVVVMGILVATQPEVDEATLDKMSQDLKEENARLGEENQNLEEKIKMNVSDQELRSWLKE